MFNVKTIKTQLLSTVLAAATILGFSANAYAESFNADSSTTIPINGVVQGTYVLGLPASIDQIIERPDGDSATIPGLAFDTSISFDHMTGKALRIHLSAEGDVTNNYEVTDGGSTTLSGIAEDYFIVPKVNTFVDGAFTDKTEAMAQYVPVITGSSCLYYERPFFGSPVSADDYYMNGTDNYSVNWLAKLTADSADLHWVTKLSPGTWKDVPNGDYTGNVMFTWESVNIDPDLLQ